MAAISIAMCQRIITNLRFRLKECQQRYGHYLDNIIFKNTLKIIKNIIFSK